ncbi:hypothetical protein GGI1_19419 [Acidithiobacillus sp. GGI-221]|nr:hypothetical protein GGI1_19419 [Acidithiobacillus sp. GGI-221]
MAPPCDNASRRARESDLPVAPVASMAAILPTVRASDADGFAPSAAAPLCDSARRRSSAAARVERGDAILFAIESLMT